MVSHSRSVVIVVAGIVIVVVVDVVVEVVVAGSSRRRSSSRVTPKYTHMMTCICMFGLTVRRIIERRRDVQVRHTV